MEDLKYACSQATMRNRTLQIHAIELCEKAGIDPSHLGIDSQLLTSRNKSELQWRPSTHLNSGIFTSARRSASNTLTSGDILRRSLTSLGSKANKSVELLEDDLQDRDILDDGTVKMHVFTKALKTSGLLLSDKEIGVIAKSASRDSYNASVNDEDEVDEATIHYREFLKAIKPLAKSVSRNLEEADDIVTKGYANMSVSRTKAKIETEKNRSEHLISATKHLNRMYKNGDWNGVSSRKLRLAFEEADTDDTGAITVGEYRSIISDFDIPLDTNMVKAMLVEFQNRHGDIRFQYCLNFLEKWNSDIHTTGKKNKST